MCNSMSIPYIYISHKCDNIYTTYTHINRSTRYVNFKMKRKDQHYLLYISTSPRTHSHVYQSKSK